MAKQRFTHRMQSIAPRCRVAMSYCTRQLLAGDDKVGLYTCDIVWKGKVERVEVSAYTWQQCQHIILCNFSEATQIELKDWRFEKGKL
jgi:hypothetical protein